jgi:hypothetical protein
MTANLKAPIIINSQENIARQIVLQDNKLTVQYEMYKELRKAILSSQMSSSDDSSRTRKSPPTVTSTSTSTTEATPNRSKSPSLEA